MCSPYYEIENNKLFISRTNIRKNMLENIFQTNKITSFTAYECDINDDSCKYISNRNIKYIGLDYVDISQSGTKYFANMESLETCAFGLCSKWDFNDFNKNFIYYNDEHCNHVFIKILSIIKILDKYVSGDVSNIIINYNKEIFK